MEKHLQRNDSIVGNYPSCMCGIMHILDYHHVKKLMPHKKKGGRRRIKHNGSPKRISKNRDSGEEFMDVDAETLPSTDSIPARRRSRKSRIKLMNDKGREEGHRSWILSFPLRSWLQKANPVHHLEPSENYLGHTGTGKRDTLIVPQSSGTANAVDIVGNDHIARKQVHYPENGDMVTESSASQNLMKANEQQLDDYVDFLEIFKVNKEFFLKILQEPDVRKNQFHGLKNSNIKVKLTKSRSFPVANTSQARSIRPSTLKHKQNEVWLFLNGEKSVAGTRAQKLEDSKFQKDHYMNSITADGEGTSSVNSHGWNQLVINRFRDITQKIKQALKESKRGNDHTPVEADYQSNPFGGRTSVDGTDISERLEITIDQDGNKTDRSNDDLSKRRLQRVRRTSSLNESLDKYTQLFENAFGRETKYSHCRSLRVTTEEKVPSNAPKSCRRNLSLPDLDSFSFLNGPSHDAPFRLGMPIKTLVDHSTNKDRDSQTKVEPSILAVNTYSSRPLETVEETDLQRSNSNADIEYSGALTIDGNEEKTSITDIILKDENKPARESSVYKEEDIYVTNDLKEEISEPNHESVIETCFQDDLTSSAEFPTSEGLESNITHPQTEDPDSSILQQHNHLLPTCHSASNRDLSQHFESENADFNYVQALLELSGFIGNEEQAWTWDSLDQPLSRSLFKQMEEDYFRHELIEVEEEDEEVVGMRFINRHLLFDLVNETLGEMIEKSYTYFPRGFSFGSNIRRTPKGHHLVEEVWNRTSKSLSLRPELDQTLDDVVARDLDKGDGWMKLEWESEIVALEIEDLIFDQLLDEVICSSS